MRAATSTTLTEVAEAWLDGARSGAIRTRSGDAFKPSTLRGYQQALKTRVLPELGGAKLRAITRADLQRLVESLHAEGLDASTVRNAILPLRSIFRRAVQLGDVAINPTSGLELPAVRGRRDRIASPQEAAKLIGALPREHDRALWATAMYSGLRLGELRALRWEDVDLAGGVIRCERSWDAREGVIQPKSRAGRRTVPIPAALRDHLVEHRMAQGRETGLVFGARADRAFNVSSLRARALTAWEKAKLAPIGLHEARHTYASLMIAAGVNAKTLSTYMGHGSIAITLDTYSHLMPGSQGEAAEMLNSYLARAATVEEADDEQAATPATEQREEPTPIRAEG